jgi:hypothetical protein
VSYQQESDDLDAEILAELYLRHIARENKEPGFVDATRLLRFLRSAPLPPRNIQDLPLSSYLRLLRNDHGVLLGDMAAALKLPTDQLEKLESNTSVPWDVPASTVACVVCFYRLTTRSLESLSRNSCNMAVLSGRVSDRKKASQSLSEWLSQVRSELRERGAKDLIA